MITKNITDRMNITVGENLRRRPCLMACENDIHEVANTELHNTVVDVLSELGVDGQFYWLRSGKIGIIEDPDFTWLHVDMGHAKLVVHKSIEFPTPLYVNNKFYRQSTSQIGSQISWIYVKALKQSTTIITL